MQSLHLALRQPECFFCCLGENALAGFCWPHMPHVMMDEDAPPRGLAPLVRFVGGSVFLRLWLL